MFDIVIEKNVALPATWGRCTQEFPFPSMGIGDSFSVPFSGGRGPVAFAIQVRAVAHNWGKKNDRKFAVRLTDERTRVRVWRIA